MNVQSPVPVAVVLATVSPTFSPCTVSNVIFNFVSVTAPATGSTTTVCPAVAPNGTATFVTCSTPVASWYPAGN